MRAFPILSAAALAFGLAACASRPLEFIGYADAGSYVTQCGDGYYVGANGKTQMVVVTPYPTTKVVSSICRDIRNLPTVSPRERARLGAMEYLKKLGPKCRALDVPGSGTGAMLGYEFKYDCT